jgi:dTDP-4-dehydrorhamnose reductase
LKLVADAYGKTIDIEVDENFVINRSLDSSRFRSITGFQPKPWGKLVKSMKDFG